MGKLAILWIFSVIIFSCSHSQNTGSYDLIGGPCEGCEAVLEHRGMVLNAVDTLPGFEEAGTQIKLSGTVYQKDGKTPAGDIILYFYQTNQEGIYQPGPEATGWERQHGYIRGWLKTDENGSYTLYTLRPAPYPSRSEPAHIHVIVLEPDGRYYWIEGYHFEGDPLLTDKELDPDSPRGGKGLVSLTPKNGLLVGERDIFLGRNIEDY